MESTRSADMSECQRLCRLCFLALAQVSLSRHSTLSTVRLTEARKLPFAVRRTVWKSLKGGIVAWNCDTEFTLSYLMPLNRKSSVYMKRSQSTGESRHPHSREIAIVYGTQSFGTVNTKTRYWTLSWATWNQPTPLQFIYPKGTSMFWPHLNLNIPIHDICRVHLTNSMGQSFFWRS